MLILSFYLGMSAQKWVTENNLRTEFINGKLAFSTGVVKNNSLTDSIGLAALQEIVLPQKGYNFKIKWGDLGKKMVDDGVIDETKLAKAITGTDTLPPELKKYLDGLDQGQIELNAITAPFWLDMLWGLGLSNKNEILNTGPMVQNGDTANFASTGGWTIGVKKPMQVYSKYAYIQLTPEQQALVKEVAGGVFRPCCGNSTAFPDCNHGMAALALIELLASQNFSKDEIYKTVLAFNSYWFPQTYLDISYHFAKNGRDYTEVPPAEILSKTFSSATGYQVIKKQIGDIAWPTLTSGKGCGV